MKSRFSENRSCSIDLTPLAPMIRDYAPTDQNMHCIAAFDDDCVKVCLKEVIVSSCRSLCLKPCLINCIYNICNFNDLKNRCGLRSCYLLVYSFTFSSKDST